MKYDLGRRSRAVLINGRRECFRPGPAAGLLPNLIRSNKSPGAVARAEASAAQNYFNTINGNVVTTRSKYTRNPVPMVCRFFFFFSSRCRPAVSFILFESSARPTLKRDDRTVENRSRPHSSFNRFYVVLPSTDASN